MSLRKLSIMDRLPALIRTPRYHIFPDGLPTVEFSRTGRPKEYSGYASTRMKGGKTALVKYLGCDTPMDPGNQHFHNWGFVKYLEGGK